MFSEKTTWLLSEARKYRLAKRKVLVLKYADDDRYVKDGFLATHDMLLAPVKTQGSPTEETKCIIKSGVSPTVMYEAVPCTCFSQVEHLFKDVDVICADEMQFFGGKSVDIIQEQANHHGKTFALAALRARFMNGATPAPWDTVSRLVALADELVPSVAVCVDCGAPAPHTDKHTIKDTTAAPDIEVGGTELYKATCRACSVRNRNVLLAT